MALTNAEHQALFRKRRNELAYIATALREYDAALFARLQEGADRARRKSKGHKSRMKERA
jgi:hypothetical protein